MKFLLDVNVLLAANWQDHPQHELADTWLQGKKIVLCPLTELGFLRISTQPKAFNASMANARSLLKTFQDENAAEFVSCDLPGLESSSRKSDQVTDNYLATLAAKHGLKLATFDSKIQHPAVAIIA